MSCYMEISTWNGNYKAYNRGPVRFPRPGPVHSKQAGCAVLGPKQNASAFRQEVRKFKSWY